MVPPIKRRRISRLRPRGLWEDVKQTVRDETRKVLGKKVYRDLGRVYDDLVPRRRKKASAQVWRKSRRRGIPRVLARFPAFPTRPLPKAYRDAPRAARTYRKRMPYGRRYRRGRRRFSSRRRVRRGSRRARSRRRRIRMAPDPIRRLANRRSMIAQWEAKWEDNNLGGAFADRAAIKSGGTAGTGNDNLPIIRGNQPGHLYTGSWVPPAAPGYTQAQFYSQYFPYFNKVRVLTYTVTCRVYNNTDVPLFIALYKENIEDASESTTGHRPDDTTRMWEIRRHPEHYKWTAIPARDSARPNFGVLTMTVAPMAHFDAEDRQAENFEINMTSSPEVDAPAKVHTLRFFAQKMNAVSPALTAGDFSVRWYWKARVLLTKPKQITMG